MCDVLPNLNHSLVLTFVAGGNIKISKKTSTTGVDSQHLKVK